MPEVNPFDSEQAYSTTVRPVLQPKPISWSVWNGTPLNPSCGRISLETGAKVFLRGYMIIQIIFLTLFLGAVFTIGLVATFSLGNDLKGAPRNNSTVVKDLEKFERSVFHGYIIVFVIIIANLLLAAYASYKCRKALEQGNIAQMRKYFWMVFWFVLIDFVGGLAVDHDILSLFLVEIPMDIFSVVGLAFLYNYILERIQSANTTLNYRRVDNLDNV